MFVLKKGNEYTWPVSFETPSDGGKFDRHSFDCVFRRIPQSKIKEMVSNTGMNDAEFVREVLVGWKGIKDEQGQEIPFSELSLEEILDVPGLSGAIATAYLESIAGAKRKN